jgi:hypothetical protein
MNRGRVLQSVAICLILSAFLLALALNVVTAERVSPLPILFTNATGFATTPSKNNNKYAVATYIGMNDIAGSMLGTFSIKTRLHEFGMRSPAYTQVVMIPKQFPSAEREILHQWFGQANVVTSHFDTLFNSLLDKKVWKQVFSKLAVWNLTDYSKVVFLDNDVYLRKSIAHWFEDYPPPAATQARGSIEWNSGAMVIAPDRAELQRMIDKLPLVRAVSKESLLDLEGEDNWNSGMGQQGFISAFFTSEATTTRMTTMPYYESVLCSDIAKYNELSNKYFMKWRSNLVTTVHMTTAKPWNMGRIVGYADKVVCGVMKEWHYSVKAASAELLNKVPADTTKCKQVLGEI